MGEAIRDESSTCKIRVLKKEHYVAVTGSLHCYEYIGLILPEQFKSFWNPGENVKVTQSGNDCVLITRDK